MNNDEETKIAQETVADDPNTFTFDTSMKKKKKKKKDKTAETNPEASTEAAVAEDPMAMFGEKKKKKKKKAINLDSVDSPRSGSPDVDIASFGEKKKKKKRPDLAEFEAQLLADGGVEELNQDQEKDDKKNDPKEESWLNSDRDYTYEELLSRVFKILRENNPELVGEKKRYTIAPPQVHREGSRKTIFFNLVDICKRMHRQPEHVIQFLFAELGTSGSIDGSQRLVIKGRFQQKQIENILKRYIMEYVTCKVCKSPETILVKDNRIFFLNCEACGAVKSVSAIKTGFKAQTEKRSAQRAAG